MKTVRLGSSGLKITEVSLGCMAFGRWIDERLSQKVFDTAFDAGVALYDTADMYGKGMESGNPLQTGESEEILGRIMGAKRQQIVLATKGNGRTGWGPNDAGLSRYHLTRAVEASLRRLRTDTIDLYQVHRFDEGTPLEETLRALDDLVTSGKIRYIGCSNYAAWQIAKAHGISDRFGWNKFISVQPPYSILVRDIEKELLPFCVSEGVGTLVYSPLARGVLTGKHRTNAPDPTSERSASGDRALHRLLSDARNERIVTGLRPLAEARGWTTAQFALRWVLSRPGVSSVLLGASKPEHVLDATGSTLAGERLTEEELQQVDLLCRNE